MVTKIAECNEIQYSQTLTDDGYKSSNIASSVISILITLCSYTQLKILWPHCHWHKKLKNITGIIGDGMGIK